MNVHYEKLKIENIEQSLALIYDQFITRETLCKCLNLRQSDCGDHFERLLNEAVNQEKSFVAIANGNIIGLRCNFERAKVSSECDIEVKSDFDRIGRLLVKIKSDALKKVPSSFKNYLDFELVVVDEKFCRMGIAQNLVEMSIDMAKSLKLDGILTIATTSNSVKMFEKLNFAMTVEVNAAELMMYFPELKNVEKIQSVKCLMKLI